MRLKRASMVDAAIAFAEATVPTETQMLPNIIGLAQMLGWLVHHDRAAWTSKGYRTPIQGDAGFPDLVLARNGRVVFAEVKSKGKEPDDQQVTPISSLKFRYPPQKRQLSFRAREIE